MKFVKKFLPQLVTISLSVLMFLAIFVPRYYGHLLYDAMEDELLAIGNNMQYTPWQLVFAPDFTHPGLWYVLMDIPTQWWGISHGIFNYRLIQIVIFFSLSTFSILYFQNKLSKQLLLVFNLLILSNIYIVHITFQHRMYGLVLGISIFYSLYWLDIILSTKKNQVPYWKFILLGFLSTLGFFTNYSFIWLIPIWPLTYLVSRRSKISIKQIALLFSTQFLLSAWFIPTFLKNVSKSVDTNQWAPSLDYPSVMRMVGNYFGLMFKYSDMQEINPLIFYILFVLLGSTFFYFIRRRITVLLATLFAIIMTFLTFLLVVFFTQNSILYARTSIPIVIACYVLLSLVYIQKNNWFKVAIIFVAIAQLSQWEIYFKPYSVTAVGYDFYNFHQNPSSTFKNDNFTSKSCLVIIPNWNYLEVKYFLGSMTKIISAIDMDEGNYKDLTSDCEKMFLLVQNSIQPDKIKEQREFLDTKYTQEFLDNNENMDLYKLTSMD